MSLGTPIARNWSIIARRRSDADLMSAYRGKSSGSVSIDRSRVVFPGLTSPTIFPGLTWIGDGVDAPFNSCRISTATVTARTAFNTREARRQKTLLIKQNGCLLIQAGGQFAAGSV